MKFLALLPLLFLSPLTPTQIITENFSTNNSGTVNPGFQYINVDRFDPSLGRLVSVQIDILLVGKQEYGAENFGSGPCTRWFGAVDCNNPPTPGSPGDNYVSTDIFWSVEDSGNWLSTGTYNQGFFSAEVVNLGPWDGVLDYDGTSGGYGEHSSFDQDAGNLLTSINALREFTGNDQTTLAIDWATYHHTCSNCGGALYSLNYGDVRGTVTYIYQ